MVGSQIGDSVAAPVWPRRSPTCVTRCRLGTYAGGRMTCLNRIIPPDNDSITSIVVLFTVFLPVKNCMRFASSWFTTYPIGEP